MTQEKASRDFISLGVTENNKHFPASTQPLKLKKVVAFVERWFILKF